MGTDPEQPPSRRKPSVVSYVFGIVGLVLLDVRAYLLDNTRYRSPGWMLVLASVTFLALAVLWLRRK